MGDETEETDSRQGAAWAERGLGSKSRVSIHYAQGWALEVGRSERLCYQAIQDQKRRKITGRKKGGVSQSKIGGWGGSQDTSGDGERYRKQSTVRQG